MALESLLLVITERKLFGNFADQIRADLAGKLFDTISLDFFTIKRDGGEEAAMAYRADFIADIGKRLEACPELPTEEHVFYDHATDTEHSVNLVHKLRNEYMTLGKQGLIGLRADFIKTGMTGPEAVEYIAKATQRVQLDKKAASTVRTIILHAQPEQKKALFEQMCKHSRILNWHDMLRKAQVTTQQFVDFLLTTGEKTVPGTNKTALEYVIDLTGTPKLRLTAKYLAETSANILFGNHSETARTLAQNYDLAHVLFTAYGKFIENGEQNKAIALLRLGTTRMPILQLREYQGKINSIPSELFEGAQFMSIPEIKRTIDQYRPPQQTNKPRVTRSDEHRIPRELQIESVTGGLRQRVVTLYTPQTLVGKKLVQVCREHPNSIEAFCDATEQYATNKAFNLMLSDTDLFNLYIEHLAHPEENVAKNLARIFATQSMNTYQELQEALRPQIVEPALVMQPVEAPQQQYVASRIILLGNSIRAKDREVFKREVSVPILDFEGRRVHDAARAVRTGDAVMGLVKMLGHSDETVIVTSCKAVPVPYRRCSYTNPHCIIDEMKEFLPQ